MKQQKKIQKIKTTIYSKRLYDIFRKLFTWTPQRKTASKTQAKEDNLFNSTLRLT